MTKYVIIKSLEELYPTMSEVSEAGYTLSGLKSTL